MEPSPILLCIRCLRDAKARQAWTVYDGEALCIRHAVAHFGLDNDMEEHWLYEHLYAELWERGYREVY
jgi:hypothetical protein